MADPASGQAIKALFKTPDKGGQKEKKTKNVVEKENEKEIIVISPKTTAGGSPNVWIAPPKVAVDVEDLVQRATLIFDLVKEKGVLFNLSEVRQDQQKRTVSIFVVDKRTRRIVKSTKDMVLKSLASLGVKVSAIIAGTSYAMWDVLLPTNEDAVALTRTTLETKEHFLRVEYLGRRRTTVTLYDVPWFLRDENMAAYMLQYGSIVGASHDVTRGEWRFDVMMDSETFYSVPNFLDLGGRKITIIVAGRKPSCWLCSQVGHLSANCPGKKAPEKASDHTQNAPPPSTANNNKKEASIVSPTVGTKVSVSVGEKKKSAPPPSETSTLEKSKREWLTVGKGGRKIQTAEPQSHLVSQKDTNNVGDTPESYAKSTKVKCASPGKAKFEKLLLFQKELDAARRSAPPPGFSRSTPVSPKPRVIRPPLTPPARLMPPPKLVALKPLPPKLTPPPPPPTTTTTPSTSTSPKKRQRSYSTGSSEEETPKQQKKKEKTRHKRGEDVCRVEEDILEGRHQLSPQQIEDLRVLHNFKSVHDKDVEDPRNFPKARVLTVMRTGRGSGLIMNMLAEATQAFGPISEVVTDSVFNLSGRVPLYVHPSLYRALKLTFPRDIGGLAIDNTIPKEMGFDPMSQTVGILTPVMFSPGPQTPATSWI